MRRNPATPRPDWTAKLEAVGLAWHSAGDYWNESAYYEFTAAQVDEIEAATNELHRMCLEAVPYVIEHKLTGKMGIPDLAVPLIEASWKEQPPTLYGRFDLAYDGLHPPKLLEYNADTPTALLEAAVAQWEWLEDCFPDADQFNSLHDALIEAWKAIAPRLPTPRVDFCSVDSVEDGVTVSYLLETAKQAGLETNAYPVNEIGWNTRGFFVDPANHPISAVFKLYPWEWMMADEFGRHVAAAKSIWIEPAWKMVLSNKGILPVLWKMFPQSPYLVEARFTAPPFEHGWVRKPLLSREGANVSLHGEPETAGPYGGEGRIWQRFIDLPVFDGQHPVIGSWIVGAQAHGMGIRESDGLVTGNAGRFVPHLFR